MKKLKSQLLLGIVCLVLGLMIAYQFKVTTSAEGMITPKRFDDLTKEIESLKREKTDLLKQVTDYQQKVDEIEKATIKENEVASQMKNELDKLRVLSGVQDVKGRGIIMTLTPSVDVVSNEPIKLNHTFLVDIVNELNSAGAEAISINEQRYVSKTQIRTAGEVIIINGERYDPYKEFKIKAIGDSQVLAGAFKLPGSVVDELEGQFIKVDIKPSENVEISKYNKEITYKYLKPGR